MPSVVIALGLLDFAESLSVGEVLYKDEGARFGLGSFKALGGAYAALCVLQKQISLILSHEVSLKDIRAGKYSEESSDITLVSATDGNMDVRSHGVVNVLVHRAVFIFMQE